MGANERVTIYDVARAAGVSPSTVSRTLSRPGRVSASTAKKVHQAIQELGYITAHSSAHAERDTHTIAFSVQRLSNPIYEEMLTGFRERFDDSYVPVVVESEEDAAREAANLRRILPQIDGLILASSLLTDAQIANLHKQIPMILVQRQVSGISSIMFDVNVGIAHLIELFDQHQHEELLYVSGPERSWTSGMRWRSIQAAAGDRGIKVSRTKPLEPSPSSGFDAVELWQESNATGVITFNDLQATGFLQGVDRAGLEVPRDVSLASFDNSIAALIAQVPLTSVGGSNVRVGYHAAELLKEQMKRRNNQPREIVLPMKPYFRKSLGLAPNK
ncbi:LacI family transcriptional regulator [Trueperella bonasi]|uniref:LacI family transcriptional regulator n=1 Tax=Trueperella bonasi TaxID=312286 RepID=A0ABT9NHM3_9ACTO|nr:LacI family DNA-binding transcriptional regulator [Trueperella bonasi]MDP9806896.1 LacI family transcriptional regulator [Trueperella bonasi]